MLQLTGFPIPNHYPVDSIAFLNYLIPPDLGWINANPSNNTTWTLPPRSLVMPGTSIWIRNISNFTITLNANIGNTVGGSTFTFIPPLTTIHLTTGYDLDWRIVKKFKTSGISISSISTSSNNAIVRFDGISGNIIKNSLVTLSDSGNFATSGTFGTVSLPFKLISVSVTQTVSNTNSITCNSSSGTILSATNYTLTGYSNSAFTVLNSLVFSSSVVIVKIINYSGTYTTNGIPHANVNSVTSGSFSIRVVNLHPTNSLNGRITFAFIVSS